MEAQWPVSDLVVRSEEATAGIRVVIDLVDRHVEFADVSAGSVERELFAVDQARHVGAVGSEQRQAGVDRQRRRREGVVAALDGGAVPHPAAISASAAQSSAARPGRRLGGRAGVLIREDLAVEAQGSRRRHAVAVEGRQRAVAVAVDCGVAEDAVDHAEVVEEHAEEVVVDRAVAARRADRLEHVLHRRVAVQSVTLGRRPKRWA